MCNITNYIVGLMSLIVLIIPIILGDPMISVGLNNPLSSLLKIYWDLEILDAPTFVHFHYIAFITRFLQMLKST